jgi:hypothetical protein
MDGRAQKISTAWEGWEGVILLNFHTPCIFAFVGRKSVAYAAKKGKKKKKSTHFPSMAVCYATAVVSNKGKNTWGCLNSQKNPTYTATTQSKEEIIDNHMSVLCSFGLSLTANVLMQLPTY